MGEPGTTIREASSFWISRASWISRSTLCFTAMVPEEAFDDGANQVEIFLILRQKTGVALVQTSLNP